MSGAEPAIVLLEPPPRARNILVAEDDDAMRDLLAEALARRGYAVETVADGDALFRRMARSIDPVETPLPDLLVTDVRMPGLGGLDVVTALRALDQRLPVVVITAFGEPATRARARALGAAHVLEKPFELDVLCRLVQSLLASLPPIR